MLVHAAQGKHIHTFNANDDNDYVVELLLAIKIDHLPITGIFSVPM